MAIFGHLAATLLTHHLMPDKNLGAPPTPRAPRAPLSVWWSGLYSPFLLSPLVGGIFASGRSNAPSPKSSTLPLGLATSEASTVRKHHEMHPYWIHFASDLSSFLDGPTRFRKTLSAILTHYYLSLPGSFIYVSSPHGLTNHCALLLCTLLCPHN